MYAKPMARHSKLDLILENLVIENVAAEGKAIAHTPEGQVVFVGFAVRVRGSPDTDDWVCRGYLFTVGLVLG